MNEPPAATTNQNSYIMLHDKLYVYKHLPWVREGYDPTNGGVSGRLDEIDVFSADATDEEIAEWCFNHDKRIEDACRLNKRMLWGEKAYYIEPVVRPKGQIGPMFGGNYADTSNATWGDMLGEKCGRVLPIFDRFETQEMYDRMSI